MAENSEISRLNENFGLATILKELEDAVSNASRLPLSTKVLVDGDTVLDCVDRIYTALPEELKKAQKVLEHSDKLLENVEGQSQRILADAREQAEAMTQETEIYRMATERAEELTRKSEQASIEMRHESIRYCDDQLRRLEEAVREILDNLVKNREDLKQMKYYDYQPEPAAEEK